MILDLAAAGEKVKHLRREGFRPSENTVRAITKTGSAAVEPLLALATDTELLHEEGDEAYAPLHALRLLGEFDSTAIIEPLLSQFPVGLDYEDEQLPKIWADEVPQIIGHLGAAAVDLLWAIVDDTERNMAARSGALQALGYATALEPGLREPIIAGLRERLENTDDTTFASHLVVGLANLGVSELYSEIMALYRSGKISQDIVPAGATRQLLLSDPQKRLACAKHPLWERYDQHGPFPAR